jgi:hypothetical protein
VRRAGDVMAGSVTALRMLPAVLSFLGLVSWLLGDQVAWLGAAVPLGGGILAAGSTWPGAGVHLLAAASTLAFAGVMLAGTIRDLDEVPDRTSSEDPGMIALAATIVAALPWWFAIGSPAMWAPAGNPRFADDLDPGHGVRAGAAALLAISAAVALRSSRPASETLGIGSPSGRGLGLGALAGLAAAGIAIGYVGVGFPPLIDGDLRERMLAALQPTAIGPALWAIAADELLFRGWLRTRVGAARSALVFAAVRTPLDPLLGLAVGGLLGAVAQRTGSAIPAIAARLVWLAVALALG